MVRPCRSHLMESVARITGYECVPVSEDALLHAVTRQPVYVGVNADSQEFSDYTSGIHYEEYKFGTLNHAMLCMGFGTEDDGTKFWWLKNSYETSWA
ncbi:Cysteine proteinases superfamily protein [Euphorbia peplus]|nr:Cysteine proteinases superfamily protein [Euphorbia peplus]